MDTQTQIDRLIELAIVQRSELKQLVSELPQLREYLGAEIERTFEETEPQIRTELEEFCRARASDEHAKTGAALAAKVEQLSKQLEVTTAAKYSVLMAERAENANLLAKAEARIEDAASMLTHAVKEIVTDELSRFPRAGEIDQLRKEFAEPRGLNPRGRWMPDETYQRLDLVTINGDSFVSNIDGNRERPSRTAGDWTLSAARGNGGGGGGVTSMTDLVPVPTNGQLLIGNGSAFVNSTLTAGTGISISNGAGSITINATDGNITLDDGTAAAPSLNFTNEPTTGLFRASANVMGFAVNGVSRATMTTTGVTVTGTITPTGSVHAAAGSVTNPSLAFNADQNTGLYNIGADNIGVAAGGSKVLDIATTGLGVTGTLSVSGVATLGAGAILNTPASGTLTNATGLPISTGVSGLGANVAAFLATPSSANLAAALTDETGTGANVFATSPTLTTPISATLTSPAAIDLTLGTGTSGAAITVLSASNNVGIGTTSPASKLDIVSSDNSSWAIQVANNGTTNAHGLYVNIGASSTGIPFRVDKGGAGLFQVLNNGNVGIGTTSPSNKLAVLAPDLGGIPTLGTNQGHFGIFNGTGAGSYGLLGGIINNGNAYLQVQRIDGTATAYNILLQPSGGNVGIGTADMTGLTGSGGLKINSSTAGSAGAGALVVTGGLSAGGASYFGGQVTAARPFMSTGAITANMTSAGGFGFSGGGTNFYSFGANSATSGSFAFQSVSSDASVNFNALTLAAGTGAATFAGAVTVAGTVIHTLSATPASASATGTVGTMSWDASYIYICTAANTWKRVAIATW
jgi:hypothetical protein